VGRTGVYVRFTCLVTVFLVTAGKAWSQTDREAASVTPLAPPAETLSTEPVQPLTPEPEPATPESPESLLAPLPDAESQAPPTSRAEITPVTPPSSPPEETADSRTEPPAMPSTAPQEPGSPASPASAPSAQAVTSAPPENRETSAGPTEPFKVDTFVLDPGHGGIDPGVTGSDDIREKDLTLVLAQGIGQVLLSAGRRALYTRSDDRAMTASQRAALAKDQQNAVLISLHVGRCVEGQEEIAITLVRDPGSGGNRADAAAEKARSFTDRLAVALQEKGYTVRTVTVPLRLQRAADAPALLLECGCLESERGRRMLTDASERDPMIQALAEAIQAAGTP